MEENRMKIATYIMIMAGFILIMSIFMANMFTINSLLTAAPTIFLLSLTIVFLFDSVYFIEFIDASKTPFDLLLDFILMLLIFAIATFVYYDPMVPIVFVILAVAFMVAVLKYWIASKRQNRKEVLNFIKKKGALDFIGALSYIACAVLSFYFSFTAQYLLLITAATYIGFMVYGTLSNFFNVKN
jgi:hypothetical protein